MIEKPRTVYGLDGDVIEGDKVRILDPAHFSEERKGRKNVGNTLTGDLRRYIRAFPDKVEVS
jgi:hypothetical protein